MSAPLVYEINTRCWLRELSEKQGTAVTLGSVPETEFDQWRRLGFTHIWLMGVWTTGPRARARALADAGVRREYEKALPGWTENDVGGSPYAIADYSVPPELGGDEGLRQFRNRLHAAGLTLLLDFVPNHLGLDHAWVRQRPELFVQSPGQRTGTFLEETPHGSRWLAHGKDPNFPGWTDTVQLDYRRAETRQAMTELLLSIAARCDGVRCDMAMLLLNDVFAGTWRDLPVEHAAPRAEFWAEAVAKTKQQYQGFLFLAEVYWGLEPRLLELGFDYTYDKVLYDRLMGRDAAGVQQHLLGLSPAFLRSGAHFIENHDESRVASLLSLPEHKAAALVVLGLPGMRFLHEGQLTGARRRVPVQLIRRFLEPVESGIRAFYEHTLTVSSRTAVGCGDAVLLKPKPAWAGNPTAVNFVLVQWQQQTAEFDLVAVNLAPHPSQCYAPLTGRPPTAHTLSIQDRLGEQRFTRTGQELAQKGLYLDLPAHGAQLLHFEAAG